MLSNKESLEGIPFEIKKISDENIQVVLATKKGNQTVSFKHNEFRYLIGILYVNNPRIAKLSFDEIGKQLKTNKQKVILRVRPSGRQLHQIDVGEPNTNIFIHEEPKPIDVEEKVEASSGGDWPDTTLDVRFKPVGSVRKQGSSSTRIGYAVFDVPIQNTSEQRTTYLEQQQTLRESGTIKRGSGYSHQTYNISYISTGTEEIRSSVQEVLEQVLLNPIVSCQGGPFGERPGDGDIPYHEHIINNITISTVPELPSSIAVDINMSPFMFSWYCPSSENKDTSTGFQITLDDGACWPLVKLWGKTRGRSVYDSLSSRALNGKFILSTPDTLTINQIENNIKNSKPEEFLSEYNTFNALRRILSNSIGEGNLGDDITTPNIKRISSKELGNKTIFLVKTSNRNYFSKLLQLSSYAGLADWNLYKTHNFVDDTGKYLPDSGNIDASKIASRANTVLGYTDKLPDQKTYPFLTIAKSAGLPDVAIGKYYDNLIETTKKTNNPVTATDKRNAVRSPQEYFAVAIEVVNNVDASFLAVVNNIFKIESVKRKQVINIERTEYLDVIEKAQKASKTVLRSGFSDDENIIVESIAGSRTFGGVPTHVEGSSLPVHQVLGSGSSEFVVRGKVIGISAKKQLEKIKSDFDQRCVNVTNSPYGGGVTESYDSIPFLQVNNNIFQLMGVDFVMPVTLSFNNMQGFPDVWEFEILFTEFDPKAQAAEKIKFLPTTLQEQGRVLNFQRPGPNEPDPLVEKAVEYFSLQYSLAREELLPDMRLPTKGELNSWIDILREEAIRRNSGRPAQDLTEYELSIIDICEDFLSIRQRREQIAKFISSTEAEISYSEYNNGLWADSDFYICYNPDSLWGALLDRAADAQFGGIDKDLRPKAIADNDFKRGIAYREYDPIFNIYTNYSKDYLSSGVEDYEKQINKAIDNSEPKENVQYATQLLKKTNEGYNSTEGAWWNVTTVGTDDRQGYTLENEEYLNGPGNNAFITNVINQNTNKDELTGARLENTMLAKDYFSFAWRIRKLKEAADFGLQRRSLYKLKGESLVSHFLVPIPPRATAGVDYLDGVFDAFNAVLSGISGLFGEEYKKAGEVVRDMASNILFGEPVYNDLNSDTLKSLPEEFPILLSYFRKREREGKEPTWEPLIDLIKKTTFDDKFNWRSTYQKTAIQSSNYAYYLANQNKKPDVYSPSGVDPTIAMLESAYVFDYYASKYKIDPNVIRGFVLRRSGFGLNRIAAVGDGGYFNLSLEEIKANPDFNAQVELICSVYSGYLKKYQNNATIALIATHLRLTSIGRSKFWVGTGFNKEFEAELNRAAANLSVERYGTQARNTIKKLMQAVGQPNSAIIDDYWIGYIEVSRVLGSAIHPSFTDQYDLMFNPFNAYILVDNANNTVNIATNQTPSGERVRISDQRQVVTRLTVGARLAEQVNLTAEEATLIRLKVDFGIIPHSENAIYSSMVDVRRFGLWGRLAQAYPTFKVLIINEGFYFAEGNLKLWDQFYTRGGISSIEVFKTKTDPSHKAFVTFSNMFTALTRYSQVEALRQKIAVDSVNANQRSINPIVGAGVVAGRVWDNIITKTPNKDLLRLWQKNHLEMLALNPGARIQIRMGYNSNAAELPVVFNGRILNVPVGNGFVNVECDGDGWELQQPIVDGLQKTHDGGLGYQSPTGFAGTGTEPAYIIAQTMVPNDIAGNIAGVVTGGRYGKRCVTPHFGDVYYSGLTYHTPELFMNMYGAGKGLMYQQFNWLSEIASKNAIYNWAGTTLISVSVKEPSVWKTANVCRMAVMDFVTAVEPFHTRSTLFFGGWWYPFNYAYDPSILKYQRPPLLENEETTNTKPLLPQVAAYLKATNSKDIVLKVLERNEVEPGFVQGSVLGDLVQYVTLKRADGDIVRARFSVSPKFGPDQINQNPRLVTVSYVTDFKNIENTSDKQAELLKDVNNYTKHLKWKCYTQVWPAITGLNLLSNSISSDASTVFTDATGVNTFNGVASTDHMSRTLTYSVDSDIQPAERKTLLVDTGLYVTAAQKGYYESFKDAVGKFVPVVGDSLQGVPDTPAVENSVLTGLCDTVKTMYSGVFSIQGQACIKPNDIVLLNDTINSLEGPLFVRNVTHILNSERGFVTMITPDCVALPFTSVQGTKLVTALSVGPVNKVGQYMVGRAVTTVVAAYLTKKLYMPFNMRVAELNQALEVLGSSELNTKFYANSLSEIREKLLSEIDLELKKPILLRPFYGAKRRKQLNELKRILNDKSSNNLFDILRRSRDLDLELPALRLASGLQKKVLNIAVESQLYYVDLLKELGAKFEDTLDRDKVIEIADSIVAKRLKDQLKLIEPEIKEEIKNAYELIAKRAEQIKEAETAYNAATTVEGKIVLEKRLNDLLKDVESLNYMIETDLPNDAGRLNDFIKELDTVELLTDRKGLTAQQFTAAQAAGIATADDELKAVVREASNPVRLVERIKIAENALKATGQKVDDFLAAKELGVVFKNEKVAIAASRMKKVIAPSIKAVSWLSPAIVLRAAVEVIRFTVGASIIDYANSTLRARQAVTIIPLRTRDSNGTSLPYVAGIRGHQGCVVGDDLSIFDNFLGGWLGGQHDGLAAKGTTILAALVGIEVPDYGHTQSDTEYLKRIKNIGAKNE